MSVLVGTTENIRENRRKSIDVEGQEITVFCVNGEFYACENVCGHQGGPLCEGVITGTVSRASKRSTDDTVGWKRDGKVVCCPWHGWEYDITTGECLSRPSADVRTYDTYVDDGYVFLDINE